ncbi:VanZ family protein [Treponema sp.]|uniref:VanZ family protein n=1 Tax=Treponema sp. TaxID=166 RepID=UPI00388D6F07
MHKKLLKWLPAVFIAGCNFYLSSQEHIEYMPGFWNADKLVHFICFAGFSFWVAFACNIKSYRKIWLPALIISLWAVTDEIHQSFTSGREPSALDWLSDTTGAVLGAAVFVWFMTKILKALQEHRERSDRA